MPNHFEERGLALEPVSGDVKYGRKRGEFMGLGEGRRLEKKLYTEPACKPKSISEIAAVLRKDLLRRYEAQKSRPAMEEIARPTLLVEGYAGGAYAIKAAIHEGGMQCHLGALADNSELPLTCQAAGAVQPDVLLLDLRRYKGGGRDVLDEISKEPLLRRTPLVILVDSAADSQVSKDPDLHGAWRLSRPVDSEQCVTALRSLFRLWRAILELPPEENQKDGSTRISYRLGRACYIPSGSIRGTGGLGAASSEDSRRDED